LIWFAYIFGLLGFALKYFDKKKYPKTFKTVLVVLVLLFSLTFWYEKKQSLGEIEKTRKSNKELNDKVDSLRNSYDSLSELIEPLIESANLTYPNMPTASALKKLADSVPNLLKGITQLQGKLLFLKDKTQTLFNTNTKQFQTIYVFRSQSGSLSDIGIRMKFENTFDSVVQEIGRIGGSAIVIESGSRFDVEGDRKGFNFQTNELHPGNDIILSAFSPQELRIVFVLLSP
jgi:hypothetical protein